MTFRPPVRDLTLALKAAGHDSLIASAFPDLDAETAGSIIAMLVALRPSHAILVATHDPALIAAATREVAIA